MVIHKLIKSIILSLTLISFGTAVHAAPALKTLASNTQPSSMSLDSLKKLNDSWELLKNPVVKQSLIKVMGNKYPLFKERTDTLNQPKVLGDEIYSNGGVKGLYTIQETAFSFNTKTKSMQVALLDDSKLNIWGAADQNALSQPMKNYIADLQSRAIDVQVQTLFEAPNQSTIELNGAPSAKSATPTNLNLSSLTGTYKRDGEFDDGELKVLQVADGQIKFDLYASYYSNTGEVSGTVQLANNQGVYQGNNYQLVFVFNTGSFNVQQNGDGPFGGMSVSPDGTYNKASDDAPTFWINSDT